MRGGYGPGTTPPWQRPELKGARRFLHSDPTVDAAPVSNGPRLWKGKKDSRLRVAAYRAWCVHFVCRHGRSAPHRIIRPVKNGFSLRAHSPKVFRFIRFRKYLFFPGLRPILLFRAYRKSFAAGKPGGGWLAASAPRTRENSIRSARDPSAIRRYFIFRVTRFSSTSRTFTLLYFYF